MYPVLFILVEQVILRELAGQAPKAYSSKYITAYIMPCPHIIPGNVCPELQHVHGLM